MRSLGLLIGLVAIGGITQSAYSDQPDNGAPNGNCPFGVCQGVSIDTFLTKESPQQVCKGRMCLVRDVPYPVEPFTEYSVAFTGEGTACGIIASYQAQTEREVLEAWAYVAMVYTVKYGGERAFDEPTKTIVWTVFEDSVDKDIQQVTLTVGEHNEVYLLTDITSFSNNSRCG